ncbi:subunit 17 of mediator complex-domain-containing protein [Multifurca ochricompacta]|uniref:Mediator of RNA polymerase II transcription subunit 17 n=1 Tax=Multifurca ochricompacta TaxID=376703 RepID=A0AAD4MCM2_9AGAM|nr:subunit 17 of mediator complex-domain-containing protein [Multifurca ochricompacta]
MSRTGLKLSLERLYKDDFGRLIPTVFDITADGRMDEHPGTRLGENLRRMFLERGLDFFDQDEEQRWANEPFDNHDVASQPPIPETVPGGQNTEPMSPETLSNMRLEILPQLHIALGEMTLAKDILSLYAASTAPTSIPSALHVDPPSVSTLPNDILSSSSVMKPPSIPSVQSFDSRLVAGGKDGSLRKASELFKSAANAVERGHDVGARYWMDALKIRRRNWGLTPAPLPLGVPTGRGAERTTKDFLISFGLSESSPVFRQRATGQLATYGSDEPIVLPRRQRTVLCIIVKTMGAPRVERIACNNLTAELSDCDLLQATLRGAQREILEQEIFSLLIRDASVLPTSSVRVSERLLVVEATQTLRYAQTVDSDPISRAKCDLIYHFLHLLLLREHTFRRLVRIGAPEALPPKAFPDLALPSHPTLPLLQPVIDLLQYEYFCVRVKAEMNSIVQIVRLAGIPVKFHFDAIGENSTGVLESLIGALRRAQLIWYPHSRSLRFTFSSPSSLVAHLSQATLPVSSIPQLQCLLQRICEMGTEMSERLSGTWLVDMPMNRVVGKWEGHMLTFSVMCDEDLQCSVSRLVRLTGHEEAISKTYATGSTAMFSWIREIIELSLAGH